MPKKKELTPQDMAQFGDLLKMNRVIERAGLPYPRLNMKMRPERPSATFSTEEREAMLTVLRDLKERISLFV